MKREVRLWFSDFSTDFEPRNDFFFELISREYKIVLDPDNPDFLIYSCYGKDHLKFDCVRIFYTAESIRPDFNLCDYAIGFDHIAFEDRYLRFPSFARYGKQFTGSIDRPKLSLEDLPRRKGFCNFLYSNPHADPIRDRFFQALKAYKRVDSAGRHLNNMPETVGDRYAIDWRQSKIPFLANYKFTIAFENSSAPGYVTEKILHALLARTIPIYWGSSTIQEDINPAAFVHCPDEASFAQAISRVRELDNDDQSYLAMVNQSAFGAELPRHLSDERVMEFFRKIFGQKLDEARRRPRYGTTLMYEEEARSQAAHDYAGTFFDRARTSLVRRLRRRLA